MTPLLFILVATVVLSVLILWVLRSVVNIPRAWPPQQDFAFESSSELALSEQGEYYLAQDSIGCNPLEKAGRR